MSAGQQAARTLVLLRHARAVHGGGMNDEMRVLTPGGRRQARGVGDSLASAGIHPDRVLCSTAVRTRQTCDLVVSALGTGPEVELLEELYDSGVAGSVEAVAAAAGAARTLLVVGHEPVMSGVAGLLAGPGSDRAALARVRAGSPTGAYAVLSLRVPWRDLARGVGVLETVVVSPHPG